MPKRYYPTEMFNLIFGAVVGQTMLFYKICGRLRAFRIWLSGSGSDRFITAFNPNICIRIYSSSSAIVQWKFSVQLFKRISRKKIFDPLKEYSQTSDSTFIFIWRFSPFFEQIMYRRCCCVTICWHNYWVTIQYSRDLNWNTISKLYAFVMEMDICRSDWNTKRSQNWNSL